jgi:protein arginine N-methyltransferase 1
MGYVLLRESMMDSVIRARDKFIKRSTGLMFPSHTTVFLAPVCDEDERKQSANEYSGARADWSDFEQTTNTMYGVDMSILGEDFTREQKEYYMLSSRWTELPAEAVLAEPAMIKAYDMMTCTLDDARGITADEKNAQFDFEVNGDEVRGPVSGFSCWFTADFRSRSDAAGIDAMKLAHPAFLSTGPENGYTHWGQQTFYFLSSLPTMKGETTRINGGIEMMRQKENCRLYNCRYTYTSSRRRNEEGKEGQVLMKSAQIVHTYQIP